MLSVLAAIAVFHPLGEEGGPALIRVELSIVLEINDVKELVMDHTPHIERTVPAADDIVVKVVMLKVGDGAAFLSGEGQVLAQDNAFEAGLANQLRRIEVPFRHQEQGKRFHLGRRGFLTGNGAVKRLHWEDRAAGHDLQAILLGQLSQPGGQRRPRLLRLRRIDRNDGKDDQDRSDHPAHEGALATAARSQEVRVKPVYEWDGHNPIFRDFNIQDEGSNRGRECLQRKKEKRQDCC
jgi:hypothetical protein